MNLEHEFEHEFETAALKPLIAVPTTAGTGSKTTGVAIFDYKPLKAKTGIASRAIKPTLGIVDPEHTLSMPERVAANSSFDVLCHALESYTSLPYNQSAPCPSNPIIRPTYQGSNNISDAWSRHAFRMVAKYLKRVCLPSCFSLWCIVSYHLSFVIYLHLKKSGTLPICAYIWVYSATVLYCTVSKEKKKKMNGLKLPLSVVYT